ncbi:MAG: O-antigen ligase family protein [Nitrospirota bacterium]|nr:O-antigen ligase family protein [Nitrospirota bacterium]
MKNTSEAHYKFIFAVLLLFGLSLPLSKSFNSVLMGLVYIYSLAMAFFCRDFRKAIACSINQPLTIPIILYVLVSVLGLFISEDLLEGVRRVKTISNLLLIYIMVSTLMDFNQDASLRFKRGEQLLLSLLAGLFIFDLIGLFTYFGIIGNRAYMLPLSPLGVHHIWFANLNAVGLYTAASLFLFSSYRRIPLLKVFIASFIIIGSISILLSTSRTAWFGLAVVVPLFAFFLFKKKKHFLISMLFLIGAALLLYLFNSTVHARIAQIFSDISGFYSDSAAATSVGARFMMWKASWKMFLSNPLFGVGTGDYIVTISRYVESGEFPGYLLEFNQPHNIFVFALATNGLLGLTALLFVFCSILKLSKKHVKSSSEERLFGFVSLAVAVHFMVAGLADSLLHIHVLLCTFAFVMGVCVRRSDYGKEMKAKKMLKLNWFFKK